MIGLLQRVTHANVAVNNEIVGEIDHGILVLIGIEREDDEIKAKRLIDRLLSYRVFADENNKMNLSLSTTAGGLLLVPQFTLAVDTKNGSRPGFSGGAPPEVAKKLFLYCVKYATSVHNIVESGIFGADMKVSLTNDGPVTFTLNT
ncbi:MAG: D-aminoacyl-tRNA deacylase [Gammaproteobacteria bacterium]|nr:D-aminoacyl-tRNA deacylase [Gammaproteobacteria bacterium]